MTVERYIRDEVFAPRLRDKGILVVYDSDRRYGEICLSMNSAKVAVVDASPGSIEAREKALERLLELGSTKSKLEGLLVYTLSPRPQDDDSMQKDPFAIYMACGRVFPDGDGDRYENICLKAKPSHAAEVRKVFRENTSPSFAVINQIGGGPGWPQLQALLGADSAREILFRLLAPTPELKKDLNANEPWGGEAKELVASCLGLKVRTKGKSWSPFADELWQFVLFSEFVFDLPVELPAELAGVPKADLPVRHTVEELCERLRQDQRATSEYVRRAEEIESNLKLPILCEQIEDLGVLDTFPFEERTFMNRAQKALTSGDLDTVRHIVAQHRNSVWKTKGENQAQWTLIKAASELSERSDDLLRELPAGVKDLASLIQHYIARLREADRLHREFEQAVESALDAQDEMESVISHARRKYRGLVDRVHELFLRYLEEEGWPATGIPSNTDTFDRCVAPLLQEKGNRVALILVDALRYELGLELKRQIADGGQVEMDAVCAALPTITPVGMASLLPEAGAKLRLVRDRSELIPALGDMQLPGLQQRLKVLAEKYGQRFHEMKLTDFIKSRKTAIPERIDLLVLRTTEMDESMEVTGQMTIVAATLSRIRTALNRLRERGFLHVVIATDHGFVLNATAEAGDTCAKPTGDWLFVHDRAMLGTGDSDAANLVISAAKAGIRGEFDCFGTPRCLIPYRSGTTYFHGGASLQEAIVPVIRIKIASAAAEHVRDLQIRLTYRNGATKITTQRPVIEVIAQVSDIFGMAEDVEILIEARDVKGNVIGEPTPGGAVDPATNILRLAPGKSVQVPLKMHQEFEGKFTVHAINPTTLAVYGDGLKLETDYAG